MTRLQISMAVSALTITLAPQVSAYATDEVYVENESQWLRLARSAPLQSEPVEQGFCAMDMVDLLARARNGELELPTHGVELACMIED